MADKIPEGTPVDDVSDGESEENRRAADAITTEFVKQHFKQLREMVAEQEKKEKLKKVVDDVLRDATQVQQGTTSKYVENGETSYQRLGRDPPYVSYFQSEPNQVKTGLALPEEQESGKQRRVSPIRKMASLTEPRKLLFQARRKDNFEFTNGEGEDDDLTGPYQRKTRSCFTQRIATAPRPPRLRMPTHVKMYDGLKDPDDHMSLFCAAAENHADWTMPVWCHMFEQTLEGPARLWFNSLPPGSIDSFEELQDRFETHFMHQRLYEKDRVEIHNIKQGEHESVLDFLKRFNKESMEIRGATESMRVSGYMHAIKNRQLIEQLNRNVPKTMKEAEQRSRDFVWGKEAAALTDGPPRREGKVQTPWRREETSRGFVGPTRPTNAGWNRESRPSAPYAHSRDDRKQTFTTLIKTPCEILATKR